MNYGDIIGYLVIAFFFALLLSNLATLVICLCPGRGPRARRLAVRATKLTACVLLLGVAATVWGYFRVRGTEGEFAVLLAGYALVSLAAELTLLLAALRWGPRAQLCK